VAVLPIELDGVASHGVRAGRLWRRRVHGKHGGRLRFGLASLSTLLRALVDAGSAGAGVSQPGKTPRAFVAVGPVDFKALAFGHEHAHFFRRGGDARKRAVGLIVALLLVF